MGLERKVKKEYNSLKLKQGLKQASKALKHNTALILAVLLLVSLLFISNPRFIGFVTFENYETLTINKTFSSNSLISINLTNVNGLRLNAKAVVNNQSRIVVYAKTSNGLLKVWEFNKSRLIKEQPKQQPNKNLITGNVVLAVNKSVNNTTKSINITTNKTINETVNKTTSSTNQTINKTINETTNITNKTINKAENNTQNNVTTNATNITITNTSSINVTNITSQWINKTRQLVNQSRINETVLNRTNKTVNKTTSSTNQTINKTEQAKVEELEEITISNACIETCDLEPTSVEALIINIENANITIESINYITSKANKPPLLVKKFKDLTININQTITINLTEYFKDDQDLVFDYKQSRNIKTIIKNNTAVLKPLSTGVFSYYFYATDGTFTVKSNVFQITVLEAVSKEFEKLNQNVTNVTNITNIINISNVSKIERLKPLRSIIKQGVKAKIKEVDFKELNLNALAVEHCHYKPDNINDGWKVCKPVIEIKPKQDISLKAVRLNLTTIYRDFRIYKTSRYLIKQEFLKNKSCLKSELGNSSNQEYYNYSKCLQSSPVKEWVDWQSLPEAINSTANVRLTKNKEYAIMLEFEMPQYERAWYNASIIFIDENLNQTKHGKENITTKEITIKEGKTVKEKKKKAILDPDITSCGTISEPGYYTLQNNISASGTCMVISSDNVTLDCNGYTINYSTSETGYGVENNGYDNVTIKQCEIVQGNSSISNSYAIYLHNYAENNTITNNNIKTSGDNGYGIYLYYYSNNNAITNTNITASGNNGYGIYLYYYSSNNAITNNNITTSGSGGYGIRLYLSSNNNAITNNNITTSGSSGIGIHLWSSSNNNITNTNITTSGDYGSGIDLDSSSSNSAITNTNIKTSGNHGFGIFLHYSSNNAITNNNITTSGSDGYGIRLASSSNNNSITNTNITTSGSNGFGIYLDSSNNNQVFDTSISSNNYDLYVYGSGVNNLTNCTFNESDIGFDSSSTGKLFIKWYLEAYVNRTDSNPVQSATVTAWDKDNNQAFSKLTNTSGWIPKQTIPEFWQNRTEKHYYSNYTINATKTGYTNDSKTINMTTNKVLYFQINNIPSVTNVMISPSEPTVNDDLKLNITCNDEDNTTLTAYWKWYNNSVYTGLNGSKTINSSQNTLLTTLDSGNTSSGENWTAETWCSDNQINSSKTNTTVTILTIIMCEGTITETRTLTQNLTCPGTALNIGANNIILDCNGYRINYSNSKTGYGINNSGYDNVTIKQCEIVQGNGSISNSYGIYLHNHAENNTITNTNITTSGNYSFGIYLYSSSNNTITNTNITTSGSYGYGIYLYSSSNNNAISNTSITTSGSSGRGIYLGYSSNNNTITNTDITTSGSSGFGIYLYSSSNNNAITNTNITTSGSSGFGIRLGDSNNNTITNTNITTSGSYGYGIHLGDSNNNTITNTNITTSGHHGYGIMLDSSSNNNTITNTNITTSGSSGFGIYFYSSNNNQVFDTSISSLNDYDLYVYGSGVNNLTNSTFNESDIGFDSSSTGKLFIKWYLEAYVNRTDSNPVQGATVTAWDKNNNQAFSKLTNTSGWIPKQAIPEFWINRTETYYYSNYTINATKINYTNSSKSINLTTNKVLHFQIDYIPVVGSASITPTNPTVNDNLTCNNGSVTDEDSTTVTLHYDWFNGSEWLGIDSKTLASGNTSSGQSWNCSITPDDSITNGTTVISPAVTIGSTAPTIPSPIINSSHGTNYTDENLNCFDTLSDVDNDTMNVTVKWYKNGILNLTIDYNNSYPNGTFFVATLGSGNTSVGDNWSCSMRLYDGQTYSGWGNSTGLIIRNSPPTQDNPIIQPANPTTSDNITCYNQSTSDADNQTITNIYHWYKNNKSLTVLLMPFDTNVSTTASGAVKDYSGYGNNGTLGGGTADYAPTWNSSGKVGGAYTFDGNDYIHCGTSLDPSEDSITISMWVYWKGPTGGHQQLIAKRDSWASGDMRWQLVRNSGGQLYWQIPGSAVIFNYGLEQDVWRFITLMQNSTGSYLYVDGVLNQGQSHLTFATDANAAVTIGGLVNGGEGFNGTIDEVRIYNVSLTPEQVYQRYLETKDGHSSSSTIVSQETSKGDNWTCYVTPNDALSDGTTKSASVVIGNTAPTIPSIKLNATNNNNRTLQDLTLYFNVSDIDSDRIYNTTDWRVNGTSIASLNMPFNMNVSTLAKGTVRDYSSYGNNGTLGGGTSGYAPTWINNSILGGGYRFDGDDYIEIQDDSSLDFGTYDNFTIEAWVNVTSYAGSIIKKLSTGLFATGYEVNIHSSGAVNCYVYSGGASSKVNTTTPIPQKSWVYIAFVRLKSENKLKVYINGVLNNTATETISGALSNSVELSIGDGVTGSIDEVAVYRRALSSEQIWENYQARLNGRAVTVLKSNETVKNNNYSALVIACDLDNCSTNISNSLKVLNTPPTFTGVTSNADWFTNGATLILTSVNAHDDDNDDLRINCSETTQPHNFSCVGSYGQPELSCSNTTPWQDNSEHNISCQLYDGEAFSGVKNITVYSDNTNPTTTATLKSPPGDGSYTENTWTKDDVEVNLTCSDNQNESYESGCDTTYYCVYNTEESACNPTTVYNGLFNITCSENNTCDKTMRYYSIDNANNNESIKEKRIKIDKEPPTTTINPNGSNWTNQDVDFNLTCNDTGVGCDKSFYKIVDNGTSCGSTGFTEGNSSTVTCSINNACLKRVCYYSNDSFNHVEATKQSGIFFIDKIEPSINYTSPTPDNDSRQTNNSVTINITVSDAYSGINKCWVEWNDSSTITNYSMTYKGNSTNGYCNITLTTNDGTTYWFRAWVNDTANNTNHTEWNTFRENAKPSIDSISFTPASPAGDNDDIICSVVNPSDNDSDSLSYYFSWFKNGVFNHTTFTTQENDTLSSSYTDPGDVWNCTVTPFDGYENGTNKTDAISILESCGSLINKDYNLTRDLDCNGTALIINNDNLTLDCKSHYLNYSLTQQGNGIRVLGHNNITIKNCFIIQGSNTQNSYGINIKDSSNNKVLDTNITTQGDNSYGVYFAVSSNIQLLGVNLNTSKAYALFIVNTSNKAYYNHTIINTTVNNQSVAYRFNEEDILIENNDSIGLLYITYSNNITINNISVTEQGIMLAHVENSTINNSIVNISKPNVEALRAFESDNNTIINSNLTAHEKNSYGLEVIQSDSNNMIDVSISSLYAGETQSTSPALVIENSDNNNITDSRLNAEGSSSDVYVYGSGVNNLINVSYNNLGFNSSSTGKLFIKWYLEAYVNRTDSNPVQEATVTAWDKNNNQAFSKLTNTSGWIPKQTIPEFWQNRTEKHYYSNYTINATKTGYTNTSKTINLTTNKKIYLQINNIPSVTNAIITPSQPTVNDNLKLNITCNDEDNTTLTAYWKWYNNSVYTGLNGSKTINTSQNTLLTTLGGGNTSSGENWTAETWCSDNQINSSKTNTSVVITMCEETITQTTTLTQNLTCPGTALNIGANNIILDCNGYQINYSNSKTGYGINNSGYDNVTIKNCNIVQGNSSISNSYAIYLHNHAENNTITNTNITTSGNYSRGIYLWYSNNNAITNTNIKTSGTWGYGIRLESSSNNAITNTNITTSGNNGYGIPLSSSSNNNAITNTNIKTSGTSGYGIYLYSSSNNNTITNNNITTSGNYGYGIRLEFSSNTAITNTNIKTSGSTGYGIYLWSSSNNNTITNTNITTSGTYGIYFYSSNNQVFDTSISSSNSNDIYVAGSGVNNLTNCTFNKSDIGFDSSSTGKLFIKWYLEAFVNRTDSNPVQGATVTAWDKNNNQAFSKLTNTSGWIPKQTIPEFWQNRTEKHYYSNYTINASKTGYTTDSESINLTTNKVLYFQINNIPSVTNAIITPSQPTVNDNLKLNITCNDEDNTTLTAYWKWYNNSVYTGLNGSKTINTSQNTLLTTLDSGNTSSGENWTAETWCSDNQINSSKTNTTVTITMCEETITQTTTLTQNLTCPGTALNIGANNTILDCNGYRINYSTSQTGYGINNNGYDNVTIKNCNIVQGNSSISDSYAIYLHNHAENNTITNNNITTSGNYSHGIYLYSSSNNNAITNTSITTSGDYGNGIYLYYSSKNNAITNTSITTSGDYVYGIELSSSSNNAITNTSITTSGYTGRGIYLYSSSKNNAITNTKITTSGNSGYGIELVYSSNNNTITNTSITTSGWEGHGIRLWSSNNNNTITNNNITTSGNYGYGIYLHSSNNNAITNNNITTSGSFGYGIYLYSSSNNNAITNTSITTSGSSGYGIYLYSSNNNQVFDTSINSLNSYDLYVRDSGVNNLTNCTFNKSDIGFHSTATGKLFVKWYLEAYVNRTDSNPVQSANVTAWDKDNNQAFSKLTNTSGWIPKQAIPEFWQNRTEKHYYSNYTINTTKTGYTNTSKTINLTTNKNLYLQIDYIPVVASASITPTNPTVNDNLTCNNGSVTDEDSTTVTLHYDWFNGTTWLGIDNKTLASGNTSSGQSWNCSITPDDGVTNGSTVISPAVTLGHPPTTPSPIINSSHGTNYTDENLNCFDTIIDEDNNTMNVTVKWYRNGILNLTIDYNNSYPNGTFFVATLGSGNTSIGDNWSCSMRLYDGQTYSGWGNSTGLIIRNRPPTQDNPTIQPANPTTSDNITCYNQSTSDADNQTVTNIYNWYKNEKSITILNAPFDTNVSSNDTNAVKDYSGNNHNGTLGGGNNAQMPTWNPASECKVGGCYEFDGVDDYINFGHIDPNSNELTIEWWMKVNDNSGLSESDNTAPVIIDWMKGSPSDYRDGTLLCYIKTNPGWSGGNFETNSTICTYSSSDTQLNDLGTNFTDWYGSWHHVVFVLKGTDWRAYVDGQLDNSMTGVGNISPENEIFAVNLRNWNYGVHMNGSIDELRIYNHSLTPEQVYQRYLETKDGHSSSSTIVSQETSKGDNWTCYVTPNDAWDDGTTKSASVIINNTPPEPPILLEPTNGNLTIHDRTPLFRWNESYDADGDPLTYEINITNNGVCPNIFQDNISTTNYTPSSELCTADELGSDGLYYWQVRAFDGLNYSNWSNTFNFSIEPWVVINITNNVVNFGSMNLSQQDDTADDDPLPFIMQNDGNVVADLINVSAQNGLWESSLAPLGSKYFQMKAGNTSEQDSFNWSASVTTWVNVSATNQTIIKQLNYNDSKDSAELELKVEVPPDEPPGTKQSTLIFYWEQTP